ncbi:hypothetical protein L7F22_061047 [Adiantum nelumboides]|nr:hypothetical protein [Adiantum nelumboides]
MINWTEKPPMKLSSRHTIGHAIWTFSEQIKHQVKSAQTPLQKLGLSLLLDGQEYASSRFRSGFRCPRNNLLSHVLAILSLHWMALGCHNARSMSMLKERGSRHPWKGSMRHTHQPLDLLHHRQVGHSSIKKPAISKVKNSLCAARKANAERYFQYQRITYEGQ